MRLTFAFVIMCVLASCASLVPSTLYHLQSLDPLTADPAGIEVMLALPAGLQVAPGSAIMTLQAKGSSGEVSEAFVLVRRPAQVEADDTPRIADVFKIADQDIARMKATQDRIAEMKKSDSGKTTGSLSVSLGGCGVGDGPSRDARASVFIRTSGDAPFLPLVKDATVRELIGPELFDAIGPCNGPQ